MWQCKKCVVSLTWTKTKCQLMSEQGGDTEPALFVLKMDHNAHIQLCKLCPVHYISVQFPLYMDEVCK